MTEKTLADELRAWRGSATVVQAAAHMGVSARTWNGWEQGRRFPHERILRLALQATSINGGEHGTAK